SLAASYASISGPGSTPTVAATARMCSRAQNHRHRLLIRVTAQGWGGSPRGTRHGASSELCAHQAASGFHFARLGLRGSLKIERSTFYDWRAKGRAVVLFAADGPSHRIGGTALALVNADLPEPDIKRFPRFLPRPQALTVARKPAYMTRHPSYHASRSRRTIRSSPLGSLLHAGALPFARQS